MTARVLLIDIETAPSLGWVWGKYDQNVIAFERDWYILSVAWKWLGDDIHCHTLYDLPGKHNEDDSRLLHHVHELLDEADIVIAHNGDNFDIKKINTRLMLHSHTPPSSYKTIDTLKVARKFFKFDSNKLADLARQLLGETKIPTTGFVLWQGCMNGDPKSWATMKKYNIRDVSLLEGVYLRMRPWMTNHPNLNMYSKKESCPVCQSDHTHRRGFSYAKIQTRQRWNCQSCGHWYSGKLIKKTDDGT